MEISTKAMLLLFGSVIFTTTTLITQLWISVGFEGIKPLFIHREAMNQQQPFHSTSYQSWCKLFLLFSELTLILFYAYLCENHPPYAHADRFYNMDLYYFLLGLIFIASLFTIRPTMSRNHIPEILHVTHCTASTHDANENVAAAAAYDHDCIVEMHSLKVAHNDNDLHLDKDDEIHDEDNLPLIVGGSKEQEVSVHSTHLQHSKNTENHMYEQEGLILCRDGQSEGQCSPIKGATDVPLNMGPNLLNRNQTDEWKGWMQCAILLYHYLQATDVYNIVRVMITCYVWVTGYGHFSFFYSTKDYSLNRIMRNIWRLNFLVIFTSLTMGTPYILYYSCPLHTFYFLMCYTVMRIGQKQNYTRYGLRNKFMILAFILYGIWDAKFLHLFETIHFFMGSKPVHGATNGTQYEWYFRTTLDHWSTLFGLIFALNIPVTTAFYYKLESRSFSDAWIGKAYVALPLFIMMVVWIRFSLVRDKVSYNFIHTYYSFIPVTCYVYFRNISSTLRTHHLQLFSALGRITVELYILQHHIWLTSSSKTVLTLIRGQPYLNLLLSTLFFIICSHRAHLITSQLRDMLLPEIENQFTFKSTIYVTVIVLFYLFIALILDVFNISSIIFSGILSCALGFIMYKYITTMSGSSIGWTDSIFLKSENINNSKLRIVIPLSGTLSICLLGSIWGALALFGSSPRVTLRPECGKDINNGHWIEAQCSEVIEAQATRHGNISTIGACSPGYVWGFEKPSPRSHCVFRRRTSKELIATLKNRKLIFVGDSMMRSLYRSFCTELGTNEVTEEITKKHSNFTNFYQGAQMKFVWAPFAIDQISVLSELRMNQMNEVLDLVIIGGGSWDLLHRTSTEMDLTLLNSTLENLKEEILVTVKQATPVIWLSPTRIYDQLLTAEKQNHMTEAKMEWMRNLYNEIGITSSASLYIDGLAYTEERVTESFDGVHYPKSVYSAGAQILSNSFDWLLREQGVQSTESLTIGVLSNPGKGLITMAVAMLGIYKFDSLLGLLYFASNFVQGIRPDALNEAILKTFTA